MNGRPVRLLPLLLLAAPAMAQERPVLTVLAYDSFVAQWGPGPGIEAGFEAACGCDLRWATGGDGAALLARLQLEGPGEVDAVVGLDDALVARARATGLFAPHGLAPALDLPVAWEDGTFLPFDWGWFAFVGRRGGPMPEGFEDLAASDASVVIQDPRSSTPGLGLLRWVEAAYGDRAGAVWEALADNVVTVTPGWSEAYGLFLEGEADLVLSYSTSPAYHLIAEGDAGYVALPFAEGHLLQVEVAAALAASDAPDLARDFLAYLVSPPAQGLMATGNWMYPAVLPPEGLPEGFESMRPAATLVAPPLSEEAREALVETWRAALSR